jgi:hypothetical protein
MTRTWFVERAEFTGSMVSTWEQSFGLSGHEGAWTVHDRRDTRRYEGREGFVGNLKEEFESLDQVVHYLRNWAPNDWVLRRFVDHDDPTLLVVRHLLTVAATGRSATDVFVEAVLGTDQLLADTCGRKLIRAAMEGGKEDALTPVAHGVLLREDDLPTHPDEAPAGCGVALLASVVSPARGAALTAGAAMTRAERAQWHTLATDQLWASGDLERSLDTTWTIHAVRHGDGRVAYLAEVGAGDSLVAPSRAYAGAGQTLEEAQQHLRARGFLDREDFRARYQPRARTRKRSPRV